MIQKQQKVTYGLRYDAELNNWIAAAIKQGGFSSRSAFIRNAIERELAVATKTEGEREFSVRPRRPDHRC